MDSYSIPKQTVLQVFKRVLEEYGVEVLDVVYDKLANRLRDEVVKDTYNRNEVQYHIGKSYNDLPDKFFQNHPQAMYRDSGTILTQLVFDTAQTMHRGVDEELLDILDI